MIFLNIGWMKSYNGLNHGDMITSGGKYVDQNKSGGEVCNYREFKGWNYGYVQPTSGRGSYASTIHIERISKLVNEDKLDNVLVVWFAKHPQGKRRIIGWYKNATVYRNWQRAPKGSKRTRNEGYYVKAKTRDCFLLPVEDRIFTIKKTKSKSGGFGQSNVWYGGDNNFMDYREAVWNYVYKGMINNKFVVNSVAFRGKRISIDPLERIKIERAAIEKTVKYYKKKKYSVTSVENEKIGWDLTAWSKYSELRIEVKGVSGNSLSIELTPNEYLCMKKFKEQYRIAVLVNALKKSKKLHIFSFAPEKGLWEDEAGNSLKLQEVKSISAKMWM